ncbi:PleD family two-component system response regulator [Maritalea sp.]|uniref:PleD family two-component system response regulator n=1 Tax=Maritalea sp. TaxID=2003361 RepID=UPI003EF4DCA9
MTARVLVVDDIPTNVKLLSARLTAEYFDVLEASNGADAIEICKRGECDLVLLDVMMPEMDGFETCQRLKTDPKTQHIPIVMVTALDQPSDKVRGLEAGADDFLTKPVDDVQLMARVKSLARLKSLTDELRARAITGQAIAIEDIIDMTAGVNAEGGKILLVDSDAHNARRLMETLDQEHDVTHLTTPEDVAFRLAESDFELVIVSMALEGIDPLRVCSQIRTLEHSKNLPIILVADIPDKPKVVRGLELGVNDFILRPVERNELAARVRTQVRRYRYSSELRKSLSSTVAMAVIDGLTGLYNRRYFDRHMCVQMDKAREGNKSLGLMMLDIDFFKSVNDTHGHAAGDEVLREFSSRLQRNIRGVDLACRYGGEEFVVMMPGADLHRAKNIAERIRNAIASEPFDTGITVPLDITVSVGISINELPDDTPDQMLKRADIALYRAKREGRNRIVYDAA